MADAVGGLELRPSLSRSSYPRLNTGVPEAVLSVDEVEAVLAGPDTTTPLGLRAMLEVFYSTAIRRSELLHLRMTDIDFARRTLFVRQGKGARDRFVPIGERACEWVLRYLGQVDPSLTGVGRTPHSF